MEAFQANTTQRKISPSGWWCEREFSRLRTGFLMGEVRLQRTYIFFILACDAILFQRDEATESICPGG